ncbi:MAG TPA: hypothetical protein VGL09_08120 [Methylomirabilota bacterium]|jgi:hypothetical protein
MRRCLSDDKLVDLRYETPNVEHLAHLSVCAVCTDRYRALVDDLALIGAQLHEAPPLRSATPRPIYRRWLPVATAAAAVAVVLIGQAAFSRPVVRPLQSERVDADIAHFLREVSAVLDDTSTTVGVDATDTDFTEPLSTVALSGDGAGGHDE